MMQTLKGSRLTQGQGNPRRRAIRQFLSSETAAAAVEFALVLPIAIPLFFGIFEVGRAFYNKAALNHLSDEIVRAAAVRFDDTAIDSAFLTAAMEPGLNSFAIFMDPGRLDAEVDRQGGESVIILTYPHQLYVPLVSDDTIELTSVRILP